jgi:hypothetical protein
MLCLEYIIHAYVKGNYSLGWIHNDIAIKFDGSIEIIRLSGTMQLFL